uniref:Uncharacterized protein n=1 Tax=viral metagenome TaxID=1070528 RepID=A0A6C0CFY1_9ZZZZ
MTSSESSKINDPFKVLVRVGVSIPLIILIIVVWAYFIIHASAPLVKNTDSSSTLDPGGTTTSHTEINGWDPFGAFCDSQVVRDNPGTISANAPAQDDLQCESGKGVYNCSDVQDTNITIINGDTNIDKVNPISPDSFRCLSGKEFDENKSWCDDLGLIKDDTTVTTGATDASRNISEYEQKVRYHCCDDIQYEENINYIGLAIYLVITLPIVFLLIEKILDVFIYRDQPFQKDISNQFKRLGGYISNNGAKLVILVLVFYYLLFPLLRFFFVSYKCEGTHDSTREGNCYNPCTRDDDCRTRPNPSCPVCVNNICSEGSFSDTQTDVRRVGLKVGVCSIRNIIGDLTQVEINDISEQFVPVGDDIINWIDNAAADGDTVENREQKVTSYYYKFYPRQELIINDTNEPIRVRIANPEGVSIDRFKYQLNNYLLLDDYQSTSTDACSTLDSEKKCNDNFNCKYINGSCLDDTPCKRYLLPTIESINAVQDLNDDLDLHNKVIRNGIDINAQGVLGDNVYPCNDVVIPRVDKVLAQNTIDSSRILDNDFNDWINMFELKRVECADKMGQCYMDDYVCETNDGVPIPLKNLDHPLPNEYTIGEVSNTGCSNAVYPCEEIHLDQPCTSLDVDVNGYLVETPEGGICKEAQWSGGNWVTPFGSTNTAPHKCIPNKNIDNGSIKSADLVPTIEGAKVASWVGTAGNPSSLPTTSCKSVNRITRTTIDNQPDYGISNYFRWYTTDDNSDTKLCSNKQDLSCGSGKYVNHLGTYQNDMDDSEITETCCLDEPQDRPVPLIVTMADATDPQDVSGISPIPLSRRN